MFSISPSEAVTIALIALIVFGPRRLPEIARKAGKIATQVRAAANELKSELDTEYEESLKPIREAVSDLSQASRSITEAVTGELKHMDAEAAQPFREAMGNLAAEGKALAETAEGELRWVDVESEEDSESGA